MESFKVFEPNPIWCRGAEGDLGDLKRKLKPFEEAITFYQMSVEVENNNKYALAGLGDAYRGLGKADRKQEKTLYV